MDTLRGRTGEYEAGGAEYVNMPENNNLPQEALAAIENMNREEPQEEVEAVETGHETTNDDSSVGVDSSTEVIDEGTEELSSETPETEPESWIDETEINYAKAYGFSREDLEGFESQKDWRAALRMIDSKLLASREQQSQEQPKDVEQRQDEPSYERVELDPNEFDESIVNAFNTLQDRLESVINENKSLKEEFSQTSNYLRTQEHQKMVSDFETWVDDLGHEEIFGPADASKRTQEQIENRRHLWSEAGTLIEQGQILKQNVGWNKSTIDRVANLAFYDKIERQNTKKSAASLVKQSKQRMGGGQPSKRPKGSYNGDITKHPDLLDAYRQMVNENGTGY